MGRYIGPLALKGLNTYALLAIVYINKRTCNFYKFLNTYFTGDNIYQEELVILTNKLRPLLPYSIHTYVLFEFVLKWLLYICISHKTARVVKSCPPWATIPMKTIVNVTIILYLIWKMTYLRGHVCAREILNKLCIKQTITWFHANECIVYM